jgi:cell division septation protein DedD
MDKDAMGKSFNKNTVGITVVVLAAVTLLNIREAYPAYREAELFDLGYEQYLSSQHERAVEAFTLFLDDFPRSSAKDAAMFWMAMSLIQLRRDQEARTALERMTREFPESPLKPYAVRELEKLEESAATKEGAPAAKGMFEWEESREMKPGLREEPAKIAENGSAGTHAEEGTQKSAAQGEKGDLKGTHMEGPKRQEEGVTEKFMGASALSKNRPRYSVQVAELNNENAATRVRKKLKHQGIKAAIQKTGSPERVRFKVLVGEFGTKREADLFAIKISKRTGLDAFPIVAGRPGGGESVPLSQEGPLGVHAGGETSGQILTLHESDFEKNMEGGLAAARKDGVVAVHIGGTQYTAQQVTAVMNTSFTAIHKLGIKEVIWRTGNVYEDFIDEQLLYEEAGRAGVINDESEHEKTVKRFKLSPEEAGYLERYLVISRLVDKKLRESPAERMVESLIVIYTDGDKREKELLASELQSHARKGKPFKEIHALYPQRVGYTAKGFEGMQEWIKKEIALLEDAEISVFWSKEGYVILKPGLAPFSFEAFEDMDHEKTSTVRAFVREYVSQLRKGRTKIVVVSDDKGEP